MNYKKSQQIMKTKQKKNKFRINNNNKISQKNTNYKIKI